MKTKTSITGLALCAALLTSTIPSPAYERPQDAAKPGKTYTGTVLSVDPNERLVHVRGTMWNKDFNLGDSCTFVLMDKSSGSIGDLRPGEKITVNYQNAHGVLVADRIEQKPMTCEGTVKHIDPAAHTMKLREDNRTFAIPDDCKVVLRNDHSGSTSDIQPGNHVTIVYETPHNELVARQISQTSAEFVGTITAIDLKQKMVKAKGGFTTKKFNIADNCTILLNGKADSQLADLQPNEKLVFNYDEVKGVNIVNRIATVPKPGETMSVMQPTSPAYP